MSLIDHLKKSIQKYRKARRSRRRREELQKKLELQNLKWMVAVEKLHAQEADFALTKALVDNHALETLLERPDDRRGYLV